MDIVDVPDVAAPTAALCWKANVLMHRCDRRAGHAGKHSWEHGVEIAGTEHYPVKPDIGSFWKKVGDGSMWQVDRVGLNVIFIRLVPSSEIADCASDVFDATFTPWGGPS